MKNSTKIVLVALAAIMLVATVAVLTRRATHVLASGPVSIPYNSTRTPWTSSCAPPAATGNNFSTNCVITAPAGGELVIQIISGLLIAPVSGRLLVRVQTTAGGTYPATWNTTLAPGGSYNGRDYYYWSYPVSLYADPGTAITVSLVTMNENPLNTLIASNFSLVGYYVTAPTP